MIEGFHLKKYFSFYQISLTYHLFIPEPCKKMAFKSLNKIQPCFFLNLNILGYLSKFTSLTPNFYFIWRQYLIISTIFIKSFISEFFNCLLNFPCAKYGISLVQKDHVKINKLIYKHFVQFLIHM